MKYYTGKRYSGNSSYPLISELPGKHFKSTFPAETERWKNCGQAVPLLSSLLYPLKCAMSNLASISFASASLAIGARNTSAGAMSSVV